MKKKLKTLQMQSMFEVQKVEVSDPTPLDGDKVQRITITTADGVFKTTCHLSTQQKKSKLEE